MAGITLTQAEDHLALWIAADAAVATGQSYSVRGRQLTRADAAEIRQNLDYWEGKVKSLARTGGSGGARVRYGVGE